MDGPRLKTSLGHWGRPIWTAKNCWRTTDFEMELEIQFVTPLGTWKLSDWYRTVDDSVDDSRDGGAQWPEIKALLYRELETNRRD